MAEVTDAQRSLLQAMWDALGILGFDQDGDKTPDARLTLGWEPFVESFLADIRQARADHDEAIDEVPLPYELRQIKQKAWQQGFSRGFAYTGEDPESVPNPYRDGSDD